MQKRKDRSWTYLLPSGEPLVIRRSGDRFQWFIDSADYKFYWSSDWDGYGVYRCDWNGRQISEIRPAYSFKPLSRQQRPVRWILNFMESEAY